MVVVIDEGEYSIESSNADSSILGGVEEDKKKHQDSIAVFDLTGGTDSDITDVACEKEISDNSKRKIATSITEEPCNFNSNKKIKTVITPSPKIRRRGSKDSGDIMEKYIDKNDLVHAVVKNPTKYHDKQGWSYTKRTNCSMYGCNSKSIYICSRCFRFYCWKSHQSSCCFKQHVDCVGKIKNK